MTYQPAVYRAQGGDDLVIASSGTVTMESGSTMTIASGAAATLAGTLTVASGGVITVASGGTFTVASGATWTPAAEAIQTAATTATVITASGLTIVTGTSDMPTFLMANPIVGVPKYLIWTGTSGDGTTSIGAIIGAASTGVTFDTSGQNLITLASSGLRGVSLVGVTTLRWAVVGTKYQTDAGLTVFTTP
jgi:hypothetical protein